jgi:hypothetical protein
MKKVQNLLMCIFLIAILFAISCTKQSAPLGSGTSLTPPDGTPIEIGSVVDLGLVNADTRVMATTLQTQSFVISGADGNFAGTAATISLNYYVDQDAQIPDGQYVFSNSDIKTNHTFDSAIIIAAVDSTGNPHSSENILDGVVDVKQVSGGYQFAIQGTLQSGSTFTGHTQGTIAYTDNNMY